MLSIQNYVKFQLFIHYNLEILISIYLMNTSYFYSNIQYPETRRPIGRLLTEALHWKRTLKGAYQHLIHRQVSIF